MKTGLRIAIMMGLGCLLINSVEADPSQDPRISPFSGKPVPRFESLRYGTVNGRTGPSLDHPIAWRYEREGLPVLIVKESMEWRRIRDPEGAEVWIHARMLSAHQTGMVRADTHLKEQANGEAGAIAILQNGVIVDILADKGGMVKVRKDRRLGWVEQADLWGNATVLHNKESPD